MAHFIRGPLKGQRAQVVQIANGYAVLNDGSKIVKLGAIELNESERLRFADDMQRGDTFKIYDPDYFYKTGKFKKIAWARL